MGEAPVIAPNADSSPLWSLSDQSPQPIAAPQARETRMPAIVAAAEGTEASHVAPATAPSQFAPPETNATVQKGAPPSEESSPDSRKGWWQRRFKI
jgi:hypothetical protein